MPLIVLNVAYPLAPVGSDAVGGAEQVLFQLDAALVRAGNDSIVVAAEGSEVNGILVAVPRPAGHYDEAARRSVHAHYRDVIRQILDNWAVDVVHMHGVDFYDYLPPADVPVLITLHLPPQYYPPSVFQMDRPLTFLQCVSASQRRECPPCSGFLTEIENAAPDDCFAARHAKRAYAISMGRLCPEKGFHLALDAARRARIPMLLAGETFSYANHENYFEREIVPRLDRSRRFVGRIGGRRKLRLLSSARCLLVPSTIPETSSLAAMEAMACGTPVIAFPNGALREIVDHGRTGFLVGSVSEMADAIHAADTIDPEFCRRTARERFTMSRMAKQYFTVYECLASCPEALDSSSVATAREPILRYNL